MSEWGIDMASEKRMRKKATELISDNLEAERVPLSFNHKDGGEIIKDAPIAYVPRLWKTEDLLNQSSDDNRG